MFGNVVRDLQKLAAQLLVVGQTPAEALHGPSRLQGACTGRRVRDAFLRVGCWAGANVGL